MEFLKDKKKKFTKLAEDAGVKEKSEPETVGEQIDDTINELCPSLTYQQRMIGFVILAAAGYLMAFGSFFRIAKCMTGNCVPFAMTFSLGSLVSLASTLFLMGPMRQLHRMFDDTRRVASIVLLSCIVLTITVALINFTPSTETCVPGTTNTTEGSTTGTVDTVICTTHPYEGSAGAWKILILLALSITQLLAYIWYALSYIPFGRSMATKCCKACWRKLVGGDGESSSVV